MVLRTVMFMSVVTLCMGLTSCQKLEPDLAARRAASLLKIETLRSLDAIPAEFGNLVGVTSTSLRPDAAELWFEKPDKTIVVVSVNFVKGSLWGNYLLIPRR